MFQVFSFTFLNDLNRYNVTEIVIHVLDVLFTGEYQCIHAKSENYFNRNKPETYEHSFILSMCNHSYHNP